MNADCLGIKRGRHNHDGDPDKKRKNRGALSTVACKSAIKYTSLSCTQRREREREKCFI